MYAIQLTLDKAHHFTLGAGFGSRPSFGLCGFGGVAASRFNVSWKRRSASTSSDSENLSVMSGLIPVPLRVKDIVLASIDENASLKLALHTEDGLVLDVWCSQEAIEMFMANFFGTLRDSVANATPANPPEVFSTRQAGAAAVFGGEGHGALIFDFFTHDGRCLRTFIGPNLASLFAQQLDAALNSLSVPAEQRASRFTRTRTPGTEPQGRKMVEHFGQQYPADILQALGVLMVRANLLERAQIKLLAALLDRSEDLAEGLFFSTINNKARLDMLQAQIPLCGLATPITAKASKALKLADSASGRRNDLVHGYWSYKGDKFEVETYKSATQKRTKQVVSERTVLELAEAYYVATAVTEEGADAILAARNIARNTASTPS